MELLRLRGVLECRVWRRVNRFTVEVFVGRRKSRAYLNNTGRLEEFLIRGRKGYCLPGSGRLPYRLFAMEEGTHGSVVDTALQARAFEEALKRDSLPSLKGYRVRRRNLRTDGALLDYELVRNGKELVVELKSAVLRLGEFASYPDCPTQRGRKQLEELIRLSGEGRKVALFFMTSLEGIRGILPNGRADPALYHLMLKARKAGVLMLGANILFQPESSSVILLQPDLPVFLYPRTSVFSTWPPQYLRA